MTDAPSKAVIKRDTVLEQRMLEAVIADRNAQPRSQQVRVGPSSLGFCRELLRAQLFESDNPAIIAPETYWATAAHVGTVMGADLERIFGQRLNAETQQRVTTWFEQLGVSISGAIDLLFLDGGQTVTDLKGMADVGSLLYDLDKNAQIIESLLAIWRDGALFQRYIDAPGGSYELTEKLLSGFSKLHYWVQVATYVTGCVQTGILPEDAEGRLVWYDRSGNFQEFVAVVLDIEEIMMFFEIGQARVGQVARAQELYEQTGNPALIFQLRDQPPSFCFSSKVMCPLRERCWGGSEWEPTEILESAELASAAARYDEGRRLKNIGEGMTKSAREELRGSTGVTTNGYRVSWPGGGRSISVVATGEKAIAQAARSAVDIAAEAMARVAIEPEAPTEFGELVTREQMVAVEDMPKVVAGEDRDPRLDRVHFVDTDPRPLEEAPAEYEYVGPAPVDSESQAYAIGGPISSIDKVLQAPELTERQRAWLESKKDVDPVKQQLDNLQHGVAADRAARARGRK